MNPFFILACLTAISISLACKCSDVTLQAAYENVQIVEVFGIKKNGYTRYRLTYKKSKAFLDEFNVDQPTEIQQSNTTSSCLNELQNGHEYLLGIHCGNNTIYYEWCGHVIRDSYGSKHKVEPFEWNNAPKDFLKRLEDESICDFVSYFIN